MYNSNNNNNNNIIIIIVISSCKEVDNECSFIQIVL